jgi:hypothetical protein
MSTYGRPNLSEARAPARDDAYTVMLSISLLAMIGACVILFYDLKRFPTLQPPQGYGKVPAAVTPPPDIQPPSEPAPAPAPDGATPATRNGGAPTKDGAAPAKEP